MLNVSRGLSSPITLEPDHNDVLAARDSGFLQIHCETCQEVLDSILMAYRLAEDERVLLPVLVNMDGFHLSFTRGRLRYRTRKRSEGFTTVSSNARIFQGKPTDVPGRCRAGRGGLFVL